MSIDNLTINADGSGTFVLSSLETPLEEFGRKVGEQALSREGPMFTETGARIDGHRFPEKGYGVISMQLGFDYMGTCFMRFDHAKEGDSLQWMLVYLRRDAKQSVEVYLVKKKSGKEGKVSTDSFELIGSFTDKTFGGLYRPEILEQKIPIKPDPTGKTVTFGLMDQTVLTRYYTNLIKLLDSYVR